MSDDIITYKCDVCGGDFLACDLDDDHMCPCCAAEFEEEMES